MAVTEEIACKQGCGRTFTTEGWRVRHELRCDGKPIATHGRIVAPAIDAKPVKRRKKARVASKRRTRPVSRPQVRRQNRNRHGDRTPPAAYGAVLVELRRKRDALTAAIAALEAVS